MNLRRTLISGLVGTAILAGAAGLNPLGATASADVTKVTAPLVESESRLAKQGEFPASVALRAATPTGWTPGAPFCSGSLIDAEWVLTAAHCVWQDTHPNPDYQPQTLRPIADFELVVGRTDISTAPAETVFQPASVIPHAAYRQAPAPATPANPNPPASVNDANADVALIRLDGASTVRPVAIAHPLRDTDRAAWANGQTASVFGYGRTHGFTGGSSEQLRVATATISNRPAMTSRARFNLTRDTSWVCNGDSGAPVVVPHADGVFRQVGVHSASIKVGGTACGNPGHEATVGTIPLHDWIYSIVHDDAKAGRWLSRPISSTDGKVGSTYLSRDWRDGWTVNEFMTIGGVPHLLIYREGDGEAKVHRVQPNGSEGQLAYTKQWTPGWTSIEPFEIGGVAHILQVKAGDGTAAISRLARNANGSITITEVWRNTNAGGRWIPGWTNVEVVRIGSQNYLFLQHQERGLVRTYKILPQLAHIPVRVDTTAVDARTWSSDWSHVRFFQAGINANRASYLFLMKESTGQVHLHRMNADGTVGTRYRDEHVGAGFTSAEFHRANGRTYLTLTKRSDGHSRTFAMNEAPTNNRMLGAEHQFVDRQDGYTHAKPYCTANGTAMSCPAGSLRLWLYRDGRI